MLQEVKFVPELWVKLFSISKALKNGFKIGNDDIIIHLSKGSTTLSFDRVLKTNNGFVSGELLNPVSITSRQEMWSTARKLKSNLT